VTAIVGDDQFGRFSLRADQVSPLTVFFPLASLQRQLAAAGRANVALIGGGGRGRTGTRPPPRCNASGRSPTPTSNSANCPGAGRSRNCELRRCSRPRHRAGGPPRFSLPLRGVLTYLVNDIRHDEKSTPYSMVTATDDPVVPDLRPDEIVLNSGWPTIWRRARRRGLLRYFHDEGPASPGGANPALPAS